MATRKCVFAATALGFVLCAAHARADRVYSVVDYGAKPDGKTLCTAAIQKAIDACAADGGGVVRLPEGTFLSGAVVMRSGVTLEITEKATLLGSRNRDDYYVPRLDDDGKPIEGEQVFRNLIHGDNLHDIAIRGPGTIDGQGDAFRDKTKKRTKSIYLENCRDVVIEGLKLRNAGCWMQHYRFCQNLTIRDVDVFNHVAFNNDGLNIDSCRDVTITGCRVDSDDDAIVMKSLSDQPCRNVTIADCVISSHCNALKMGTESGGGFIDMTIRDCQVFSPKHSNAIYGRQRGLAGIALEIVDGGTMENVTVSDIDIQGVSVPIFLRLGNRARPYVSGSKPGVGTLRNVTLRNVTARHTSPIGCSITGLPGYPIKEVLLENVSLGFEGGGTVKDTERKIAERETSYPESTMFGTLPAYGFYCRHARGLTFRNLTLQTKAADLRHAMMFDDVAEVTIDGLDAQFSPGAAAMLRMVNVQGAVVSGVTPESPVASFLRVEGEQSEGIVLEKNDLHNVEKAVDRASEVSPEVVETRD
jgi:polygalacturonase